MSFKQQLAVCAAMIGLVFATAASADEHAYSEGPIVNVARIRTVDGKFDDYMKWLSTTWKAQQEASKKAGYLVLVTTYKNWAALDGALAKGDEIAKQVEGSVSAANQAQYERAKIRRVLGSSTMQVLQLK